MRNSKNWSICLLLLSLTVLLAVGTLTAVIDPYFHYHAPLDWLQYPINSERYQNDGILKHFSYDAIITGSSMTENFKASECDALFGVHTVKTSFSGTTIKEIGDQMRRGLAAHPETKMVIWGLDIWDLFGGKDELYLGVVLPDYLYDNQLLNDTSYLLNKEIFLQSTVEVLNFTSKGNQTTSFDDFGRWYQGTTPGKEQLLAGYVRPEPSETLPLTPEMIRGMEENLRQNVISVVEENPDVTFYFFFTPYSVLALDAQHREGTLEYSFQICIPASKLLLEEENVRLFSFFDDYDTVTNLDNFCDRAHYSGEINSLLLQRMAKGEYRLTADNYAAYWQEIIAYFNAYDFDSLFEND